LRPCHFETANLPTWTGEIEALDKVRIAPSIAAFECRNNRLAEAALTQDGFAEKARAAIDRYGATRVGLFVGHQHIGHFADGARPIGPAIRLCPPDLITRNSQYRFRSPAYLRVRLGIEGRRLLSLAPAHRPPRYSAMHRALIAATLRMPPSWKARTRFAHNAVRLPFVNLNAPGPCRPFDTNREWNFDW